MEGLTSRLSLDSEVYPFTLAWPSHWPTKQAMASMVVQPDPMPPRHQVDRLCGPQGPPWPEGWYLLRRFMHTIDAYQLMEAIGRARQHPCRLLEEQTRCRFRVINLPGDRGRARREHIEGSCLARLRAAFPGVDADFTDGVVARELQWKTGFGLHQQRVHTTEFRGRVYVADEELWQ